MEKRVCPECGEAIYGGHAEAEFWRCLKCGTKIGIEFQEPIKSTNPLPGLINAVDRLRKENAALKANIKLLRDAREEMRKWRDEARAEVERLEKREKLNIAGSETYKLLCERTKELERLREAYKTARQEMCNIVKIAKKEGLIEIIEDTFEQILDKALEGGGNDG